MKLRNLPLSFLPSALAACLLLWPAPAAADPADIITLTVQGAWLETSCFETNQGTNFVGPCPSGQTGPMTGTFQFDRDTGFVVGDEADFSTPFATFSAFQVDVTRAGASFEFDFSDLYAGNPDLTGDSFFASYGPGASGGNVSVDLIICPFCGDVSSTWELLSGTVTGPNPAPAPEPSSLLLLGTGLLALVPLVRRRF
ncbi:MAG: PEP-CTERM sorting domain-containing protein [Candidatus Acidiferrales bacterium]